MGASPTFTTLYKKLNAEQKQAVDAIEGPVMVVAGPGTGKTQILTLRIANILQKTDTPPDAILALTFTESAAFSMRRRLVDIIGSSAYRVHFYTFHSFANEIIRRYPDEFPRIIGSVNINDIEKVSLLEEIILSEDLPILKPYGNPLYYLVMLRGAISELKRENISPLDLAEKLAKQEEVFRDIPDLYHEKGVHKGKMKGAYLTIEKRLEKNKELLRVYERYETELRARKLYDYDDMIVEAVRALEGSENLLRSLQEEYHYILADEHQDANSAQNRLLELLASFHENPNLFIVGDEKQAIFRFQGASLDNFLYFTKKYPHALTVTLRTNYRSGQTILDSAHSLIEHNEITNPALREKLVAEREESMASIDVRVFSKPEYELLFVAEDIEKKIAEGVSPRDIAVLYRNNRDADALIRIFEKRGLPFTVESDRNILDDMDIRKFLSLLYAIHHFGNATFLLPMLSIDFLGFIPLDLYKLSRFSANEKLSPFEVLRRTEALRDAGVENITALHDFYEKLSSWRTLSQNKPLLDFVETLMTESGFLASIVGGADVAERLSKVNGFFGNIRSLVENHRNYTLADLITYFDLLEEHNIMVKKEASAVSPSGVRLMTAHKSKGLEFEYVYVVMLYDGHWGNKRDVQHFALPIGEPEFHEERDKNEDERRLLYVALTRARVGLSLSYARTGDDGKERLASQFLDEIDPAFKTNISVEEFEKGIAPETLLAERKEKSAPSADKEYLNALFLEQGLSVTALNNYLECPWNYFYSNLLRVPKAPNKFASFGTAVHSALRAFFEAYKNGAAADKELLLTFFERSLAKEPLSESDYADSLIKGKEALAGYFDAYKDTWQPHILNEFRVNGLFHGTDMPSFPLRGDLDKLEFFSDREVAVVDYKTGKPKTRGELEGKTKNASGDYKRQLTFYKLLLTLFDEGKYKMVSGDIDFIQPDEKGRYHRERFLITDEDVDELRGVIEKTAREILDLSFWNSRCGEKDCRYCPLRDQMKD